MKMNKLFICTFAVVFISFSANLHSQSNDKNLTSVSRINILNPGFEYEFPVSRSSVLSANLGFGLGYPYKALEQTGRGNGFVFMIEPFLDIEYKYLYNFNKRVEQNKNTRLNSANYFGLRLLTRGYTVADYNMYRPNNYDFAIAPVWGLQRSYSKIHYLLDMGLGYAFDADNSGVVLLVQMSIGINLNKERKKED
jgi:hypothetical protein